MAGADDVVIGRGAAARGVEVVLKPAPDRDPAGIALAETSHLGDEARLILRGAAPVRLPLDGAVETHPDGREARVQGGADHRLRAVLPVVERGVTVQVLPDHGGAPPFNDTLFYPQEKPMSRKS